LKPAQIHHNETILRGRSMFFLQDMSSDLLVMVRLLINVCIE